MPIAERQSKKKGVNLKVYKKYSMVPNWSAGFCKEKSDGPTLYSGIFYEIFQCYSAFSHARCTGINDTISW
jgi:hypothetical protein